MRRRHPAILAAIAAAAFALPAARLNAQPRMTVECGSLAAFAGRVAEFREVGAPWPKVKAWVHREQAPEPLRRLLEREAARVYAEGLAPGPAAQSAYRRCQERLGEYEVES